MWGLNGSMFSGFMTSLVSNPVDVVRTRIMTEYTSPGQARVYSNPFSSLFRVRNLLSYPFLDLIPEAIAQIFMAEGVLGLYKGFVPSYLRLGSASVVVRRNMAAMSRVAQLIVYVRCLIRRSSCCMSSCAYWLASPPCNNYQLCHQGGKC
jgi:hypothetical protein